MLLYDQVTEWLRVILLAESVHMTVGFNHHFGLLIKLL